MTASKRILGVDFSGAANAGRKIWIAEGRALAGGKLNLVDLRPACELDASGVAPMAAIAALARHVAQPGTVAGCDFPFTIPAGMIDEARWVDFLTTFPARFGNPDAFRDWALRRANGRELRRVADRAAGTPFNSYNLRIYRQTWWGLAHLLHPLVTSGAAIAVPYAAPNGSRPILIEACPAASLKSIGLYRSYKGRSDAHRRQRRAILRGVVEQGYLAQPGPKTVRRLIDDDGGDALDAVIAALATAAADLRVESHQAACLEGEIHWRLGPPVVKLSGACNDRGQHPVSRARHHPPR